MRLKIHNIVTNTSQYIDEYILSRDVDGMIEKITDWSIEFTDREADDIHIHYFFIEDGETHSDMIIVDPKTHALVTDSCLYVPSITYKQVIDLMIGLQIIDAMNAGQQFTTIERNGKGELVYKL